MELSVVATSEEFVPRRLAMPSGLLVSPQRLCLEALREYLLAQRIFRAVDVASTPAAAYGLVTRQPAVALVDRLMPGHPLRVVLRHLRDRSPETRFVVLVEFALPAYVSDASAAGAMGMITRRTSLDDAVAALRAVARGKEAFPGRAKRRDAANGDARPAGLDQLTARELDVMLCLARGMTLNECAAYLGRSRNTLDNHRSRLMAKLGVHRTIELAWIALREGLLAL